MTEKLMRLVAVNVGELRERLPEPEPPKVEYDSVRDALFTLERAAQRVLQADLQQSQAAVQRIAREYPVMNTFIGYLVADGERAARADLEEALRTLTTVVDERLSNHAPVPQRLEDQRNEVLAQRRTLDEMLPAAEELKEPGTWQGATAEAYQASSATQVSALEDLAELTGLSAGFLDDAAALHRATFFLCAESIRAAAASIDALISGDENHLFYRIRQAIALIERAGQQLIRDIEGAQRGEAARALANSMEDLLTHSTVLTQATWPKSGDTPQ